MIEILQHFTRVFPMPGRIDGREDYLALVKTWSDQLEPYSDDQVKEACRRLMGKLKRFPYPSDVLDELAPASATSSTVVSLSVDLDSSSIDAATAKVEHLKTERSGIAESLDHAKSVDALHAISAQIERALKPGPPVAARYAVRPD